MTLIADKIGGRIFEKFLIPAIVVCVIIWIIEVVNASIQTNLWYISGAERLNIDGQGLDTLKASTSAYYVSYLIVIYAIVALLLLASALSLKNMIFAKQFRLLLTRLLVTNFLIISCLCMISYFFIELSLYENDLSYIRDRYSDNVTIALMYIPSAIAILLLCSFFRAQLTKEIEISKSAQSGTSSTSSSSGSSKSKSSSSASSNSEPVIEL